MGCIYKTDAGCQNVSLTWVLAVLHFGLIADEIFAFSATFPVTELIE